MIQGTQESYFMLRLSGPQDVAFEIFDSHTAQARASLRIEKLLIGANSLETVNALRQPFADLKPAVRQLPRRLRTSGESRSPAVAFDFDERTSSSDRHLMPGQAYPYFRVVLDNQLAIEMYDLAAFGTVMKGWDDLQREARRSFPAPTYRQGIEVPSGLDDVVLGLSREIA